MGNMQEYGLWLALVTINAVIVSQWINYLILMSDDVAGLAAGVFLSIFLACVMFLTIRRVMSYFDRQSCKAWLQTGKAEKVVRVV